MGKTIKARKNSRKKLIFVALLIVVVICLCAMYFVLSKKDGQHTFPTYKSPQYIGNLQVESLIVQDDKYIAVHYPKTDSKLINDLVYKQTIAPAIEKFYENLQAQKEDVDELYITYDVFWFNENIVTFYFRFYEYHYGMANGTSEIKTITFHLEEEQEVRLTDVFTDPDYLEFLSEKAQEYFTTGAGAGFPLIEEGLAPVQENYRNFILTEGVLRVEFAPYQIASRAEGVKTFEIPLDEMMDKLNVGYLSLPEKPTEEALPKESVEIPKDDLGELDGKKLIALTFDDGPHNENTVKLLGILKEEDVKATFFVLGSRAEYYPGIVKQIVAQGHQLGSHTYNHKLLTKLSGGEMETEIQETKNLLYDITGMYPTTMRPPYGAYNDNIIEVSDTPIVLWSIDPEDWKYKDVQYVRNAVVRNAKDGDIILLHDIHATSVEATRYIIKDLKEQGFTFTTVDNLIQVRLGNLERKVYSRVAP